MYLFKFHCSAYRIRPWQEIIFLKTNVLSVIIYRICRIHVWNKNISVEILFFYHSKVIINAKLLTILSVRLCYLIYGSVKHNTSCYVYHTSFWHNTRADVLIVIVKIMYHSPSDLSLWIIYCTISKLNIYCFSCIFNIMVMNITITLK